MGRPEDEQPEDEARIGRRWRLVAGHFSRIVLDEVGALANSPDTDEEGAGGKAGARKRDATIRRVSALVIAARRAMELEDRYRQASDADRAAPDYREQAERDVEAYEAELRGRLGGAGGDGTGARAAQNGVHSQ